MAKTRVLSATEIAEKWAVERAGGVWTGPGCSQASGEGERRSRYANGSTLSTDPAKKSLDSMDLRRKLDELLRQRGIEPAEELVKMATERNAEGGFICDTDQRIRIWTELLSYRMPKLKAMEVSGTMDHELTVIVRKFGDGDTLIERAIGEGTSQRKEMALAKDEPIDIEVKKIG